MQVASPTRQSFDSSKLSQVNGYTKPSIQELRVMIVEHGGVFQPYLDNKVSFPSSRPVVRLNLP